MSHSRLARLFGFLALSACGSESAPPRAGGDAGGSGGSPSGSGGNSTGNSAGAGGTGGAAGAAVVADAAAPGGPGSPDAGSVVMPPPTPANACSEMGAGATPVAGFVKAEPSDTRFPFTNHFMGIFSDNPRCVGMTSIGDLDNDGDADFSSGQRDVACSGQVNAGAPMLWWEYCGPDHWVKHTVGTGYKSAAGGGAGDFDGDGWIDLVGGDSWFKNPGSGVRTAAQWTRYATGAPGNTEEIRVGDVTADGKPEVLYVQQAVRAQVRAPGPDPTQPWVVNTMLTVAQSQGGSIGDLDGDGRNDILLGDRWWYRSAPDAASPWLATPIPAAPAFANSAANGSSPITAMADVDTDGDMDILVEEHWGTKVAWFENMDARGTAWVAHMVVGGGGPFPAKTRSILHGLMAFDFDNDGDIDILVTENQGQFWIYENTDGKGTFAEHTVAMGGAHEPRVADVDCDGDLDFVGVPWGDPADGAAGASETIRAHVYFKNELVERGGPPLFTRPRAELWNLPNRPTCNR